MTRIAPLLAEVSDKEPTLLKLRTSGACSLRSIAASCSLAARAVVIPAAVSVIWLFAVWSAFDRFVGAAILNELGRGYVMQS
jgi:hypothetical protein